MPISAIQGGGRLNVVTCEGVEFREGQTREGDGETLVRGCGAGDGIWDIRCVESERGK
jgi:hypothetical protein